MARFEKRKVNDTFKIRDTEEEKWVGDGNGRRVRMRDEERIDTITEIMNERVEGS
jgi:hypothetical protein